MSNAPIETKRAGSVKAAIWENQNDKNQTYHIVVISRSYRDGEGDWKETSQLFTEHLPLARLVSDQAYAFIHERMEQIRQENRGTAQEEASEKSAPAKKRGQKTHAEKVLNEREKQAAHQPG